MILTVTYHLMRRAMAKQLLQNDACFGLMSVFGDRVQFPEDVLNSSQNKPFGQEVQTGHADSDSPKEPDKD